MKTEPPQRNHFSVKTKLTCSLKQTQEMLVNKGWHLGWVCLHKENNQQNEQKSVFSKASLLHLTIQPNSFLCF